MRPREQNGFATLLIAAAIVLEPVHATELATIAPSTVVQDGARNFPGMDQSINVDLARNAGIPARKPYINVEGWGDLWNLLLLFGGGVCGFVVGRRWDQLWGRRRTLKAARDRVHQMPDSAVSADSLHL